MITNPDSSPVLRRIAMACLAGVALALPVFVVSIEVAGGGHGSNWAFYAFFAPEWLVWMLPPEKAGNTFIGLWFAIVGMLGLYGVYGGIIACARSRHAGAWAFGIILGFHYVSLAWLMLGFESADQLSDLAITMARLSVVHSVVVVELFFALQLLGFQYARSNVPFRPHMTWPAVTILTGGLLSGVTLYVWGLFLI